MANCIGDVVDYVTKDENIKISGLIEKLIPCTTPETFILNKHYKVVAAPQTS